VVEVVDQIEVQVRHPLPLHLQVLLVRVEVVVLLQEIVQVQEELEIHLRQVQHKVMLVVILLMTLEVVVEVPQLLVQTLRDQTQELVVQEHLIIF
jgi:hypothetical protein